MIVFIHCKEPEPRIYYTVEPESRNENATSKGENIMSGPLAVNGGEKVFPENFGFAPWPPVRPDTGDKLRDLYMSAKWSYYGALEKQFADEFAAYHDSAYGVFMANGTVTLECALTALGIGPGDEVIVPAWTWIATGMAPAYVGATTVFADCDPGTFCLDPAAFEAAITPRTRAVMPVHLFGSMADVDAICAIAKKHDVAIVEDCAHAHGGKWNGKGVGSFGSVGSFSFQQSKIMTAGEGGLCTANDPALAEKISRLKHIGNPGSKFDASIPPQEGMLCKNYRATEFQALILLDQLHELAAASELREENAAYLRKGLESIPGIVTQKPGAKATVQNYYVVGMKIDPEVLKSGKTKADVIAAVNAEGAPEVFAGWGAPVYKHKLWNVPASGYRVHSSERAEEIISNRICLMGIQWLMSDKPTLDLLIEAFRKVMKEYSK